MQRGKAETEGENVSLKPTNGSVLIPSLQLLEAEVRHLKNNHQLFTVQAFPSTIEQSS
jgi:hypothetical protein